MEEKSTSCEEIEKKPTVFLQKKHFKSSNRQFLGGVGANDNYRVVIKKKK